MFDFKEERSKQKITLTRIAERSGVDFREVYRFDIGAFILMTDTDMEKVVQALSTLTNHTYRLSDFVPELTQAPVTHTTENREEEGQWKTQQEQQRAPIFSTPKTQQNSPA